MRLPPPCSAAISAISKPLSATRCARQPSEPPKATMGGTAPASPPSPRAPTTISHDADVLARPRAKCAELSSRPPAAAPPAGPPAEPKSTTTCLMKEGTPPKPAGWVSDATCVAASNSAGCSAQAELLGQHAESRNTLYADTTGASKAETPARSTAANAGP